MIEEQCKLLVNALTTKWTSMQDMRWKCGTPAVSINDFAISIVSYTMDNL